MSWVPFDRGSTIGQAGSECGVIVFDDEHELGARITLERNCAVAPYAITCGIYGWFVHTRYLDEQTAMADYQPMQRCLDSIISIIPDKNAPNWEQAVPQISDAIEEFVRTFP